MLLDRGANGELAAMQYSVQGLNCDRIQLFGEVTESVDLYAARIFSRAGELRPAAV
jgi:hypothetical protein